MSNRSTGYPLHKHLADQSRPAWRVSLAALVALVPLGILVLASGCQSTPKQTSATFPPADSGGTSASQPTVSTNSGSIVLREGDTVRVSFPGAENLNRVVLIRRDGFVSLPLIGEFKAAGLTPHDMELQLLQLFGPQLQTKEVSVAVESSAFPVYVTGAVLRPGKILSDRPLTALEAIMEAGGFDYTKANLKSVRVLRTNNGRTDQYTLNLKRVLSGQEGQQFQLKPADIVYVPERFNLF
jgi:polysaccharide export outer membrane protein